MLNITSMPFAVTLAIGVGLAPFANAYDSFTDLGPGIAFDISDGGQVVGYSGDSPYQQATLWNDATTTILTGLGGINSSAHGINNLGQAVGTSYIASNSSQQAVLWNSPASNPVVLDGMNASGASGINNSGQVVGISSDPHGDSQATLWTNGIPTVLGGPNSLAFNINDSGQVVGYDINSTGNLQATLWNGGTSTTILNGLSGTTFSIAYGINNSGQVVGYSGGNPTSYYQATLWNANIPTLLDGLGGTSSQAVGINNLGVVVGNSFTANDAADHGTMWTMQNGTMVATDLNSLINPDLGFTIINAFAINNVGQIVGYGTNSLGVQDAFVMSVAAVPEPSEWLLMLWGLGLIAIMTYHQKNVSVS